MWRPQQGLLTVAVRGCAVYLIIHLIWGRHTLRNRSTHAQRLLVLRETLVSPSCRFLMFKNVRQRYTVVGKRSGKRSGP